MSIKKLFRLCLILFIVSLLLAACLNNSGKPSQQPTPIVWEGEPHESEKFTITAPDEWEASAIFGGLQLAKSNLAIIRVTFTGFNQDKDHARLQTEHMAACSAGTEPAEINILGKSFWHTIYHSGGVERGYYARMESGGVMFKLVTIGGHYATDAAYAAIINSIVLK